MISATVIESPGRKQLLLLIILLAVAWIPGLWLVGFACQSGEFTGLFSIPFIGALRRSLIQAMLVTGGSLVIGFPLGLAFGLLQIPGRWLAITLLLVPLFIPAFVWAEGWTVFRADLAYKWHRYFDGLYGCVLASCSQTVSMVTLGTIVGARTLARSQVEAVLLAAGTAATLRWTARVLLPQALAFAVLGAVWTLTDPGVAQIMGYHGVASEILIAFAARYDLGLAARKALLVMVLLLPLLALLAWVLSNRLGNLFSGRDVRITGFIRLAGEKWVLALLLLSIAVSAVCPPISGLLRPLWLPPRADTLLRMAEIARETWRTTLLWSLGAGAVAVTVGLGVAHCAGRSQRRRRWILATLLLLFAMPPTVNALGLASMGSIGPSILANLVRSDVGVCVGLGLRAVPIATVLLLWFWPGLSVSANDAAAVHGVLLSRYFFKVLLGTLIPVMAASFLLASVLAAADGPSLLLLQPPGSSTFITRLFAMTDSASQKLVAAMCLGCVVAGLVSSLCLAAILMVRNRTDT